MSRVFEHDRAPKGRCETLDHIVDGAAVEPELGEHLVHFFARLQCLGLRRENALVHALGDLHEAVREQIEIAAKYAGYIDRQKDEVQRAAYYEQLTLPPALDYMQIASLSIEARQRLSKHRPETLGQASRLSGITPATVSLLLVYLKKSGLKVGMPKDEVTEGSA